MGHIANVSNNSHNTNQNNGVINKLSGHFWESIVQHVYRFLIKQKQFFKILIFHQFYKVAICIHVFSRPQRGYPENQITL